MPARTANRAPASLPERARTSWSGCRGSRVTGGGRTPAAPLPPPRAAPVRSRARGDGCRWRTDESSRSLRRTAARPWPRARRRWFRTWHRSPRERTAARRARAARDRAAPPSGSTPDWRRAARAAAGRDRARAPRTPLRTRAPARHGRHTSARKRRHHEDERPGRGRSRYASRAAHATPRRGSTLGVLRPLARLVAPVLLALHLAGVAGDETGLLECAAQLGVRLEERPRDAVSDGDGLRRHATTADVHVRAVAPDRRRDLEWLLDDHA